MALKEDILKAGLKKGIAGEQQKAASRFEKAEAALADRPHGLAAPRVPTGAPSRTFTGESSAGERKLVAVPIERIRENPFNARRIYQAEKVKELAASIATHGQKVPATAMRDPDRPGHYVLIDGHYRMQAAKAAGKDTLEVIVEDALRQADQYQISFLLNQERSAQSPLDNALAWRHLLDTGVVAKEEELAGLTGQSWANVNKTLALLKLPPAVLERMGESPDSFGIAIGYEITLLHKAAGEEVTLAVVDKVVRDGLGRRDLQEMRKQYEQPRPRKNKEVSRQYKIHTEDGQLRGVIKEWDSGKVLLEVRALPARERETLVEELKQRFRIK